MSHLPEGLCVIVVLLALGEYLRTRFRSGRYLSIAAIVALFLWSWPPSTALFACTLERWYPLGHLPANNAEAIVVLSASVYPIDPSEPEVLPGDGTFLRCRYAAWLYHHGTQLPIVTSGGGDHKKQSIMADVMKRTLMDAGVPENMISTEGGSQSTYENAFNTARILRAKGIHRIVLVTEAYHLVRATRCFRKQGLEVFPTGCAARYLLFEGRWSQFFPSAQMVRYNEDNLHEWIGLAWYGLTGKI
jgi:uncharacterized SAM-binding protein YcdF (DUF218 family)